MVVTASLARGAVRAAVEKQSDAWSAFAARLRKEPLSPPSTMRRFPEWFRKQSAFHQRAALLIVHGMVRRRSGAFAAFHPHFSRTDLGWDLTISAVRMEVSPDRVNSIEQYQLPVEISGHALERMFQRTNAIEWPVIRDCLAGATSFICGLAMSIIASGCQQCAIPAERGLLVGQVEDQELKLRTFLPDTRLNPRWQALHDALNAFLRENQDDINGSSLIENPEMAEKFEALLRLPQFKWLSRAYIPGEDPMEDAWRSRNAA